MRTGTEWTEEMIARLSELWAEGHTATRIGELMGLNKNQVIGKVHRLELPSRGSPIGAGRPLGAKLRKPRKEPRKEPWQAPPLANGVQLVLGLPLPRVHAPMEKKAAPEIKPPIYYKTCRFPMWGRVDPTHIYCDEPTALGAYCVKHAARCYEPRRQKGAQANA